MNLVFSVCHTHSTHPCERTVRQDERRAAARLKEKTDFAMDFLPFTSANMDAARKSPKRGRACLSRRLAREKAECPGCGKVLQVGTLAWAHKCGGPRAAPSDQVVEARLAKMVANATRKHAGRMARNRSRSRSATEPTPDATDASSPVSGTEVNDSACSADSVAGLPSSHC